MHDIIIRKGTITDVGLLKKVSMLTFQETFAADNTEENMNKYLEENLSDTRLFSELGNPLSEFYFAVLNEEVIGYLKLNIGAAQTEIKDDNALEIERIYVLKAFQGMKVGQLLYEKAIRVAMEKNAGYIWLGVWEHNQKAIGFYHKNGFIEFDRHIFKLGDDKQTDILMKKMVQEH